MNYCLDTNVIADIFRGNNVIKLNFEKIQNDPLFIPPIVLCELYKGAFLSNKTQDSLQFINQFRVSVHFIHFDENACLIYGKLYAYLQKKGKPTQEADLMIASIAIAHDLVLITKNGKDFANIPELKLEVW
ncbi:type II toxin-antitoxin system VapC family toxin [Candidatus Woesearchaeota archaeon]|nr:type II toxin-antitoxin system VapC family toxin [Candidatus Woesearchaeota archaeon]